MRMAVAVGAALMWAGGCGSFTNTAPGPLFAVPLLVEDGDVGPALLDTGGGFEVMLRQSFGLDIVGSAEVLAFGGFETVELTSGFRYNAGGVETIADTAIVGVSSCDCNAVGFRFLRKTQSVLMIDFDLMQAGIVAFMPEHDVAIAFEGPPDHLAEFDTSFLTVDVTIDGKVQSIKALLDTGANTTVMRRSLAGVTSAFNPDRAEAQISHPVFGKVATTVVLFDTPRLPDMIIGTDVMDNWADVWYFEYGYLGGQIGVVFDRSVSAPQDSTEIAPPVLAQ